MRARALLAATVVAGTTVVGASHAAPVPLVAFACDTAGTYDIYLAGLDGGGLRRLTESAAAETSPAWSPDGSRLAFWSSDAGMSRLSVLAVAGGAREDIDVNVQPDSLHRLFAPAWSPDGRWIVFESNRDAPPGATQTDLYVVRPDGTGLRRITSDEALSAAPEWSRDGRSVVFSRQFGRADGTRFPEVFVRRVDGSAEQRLTTDDWHDWDATWSPRGGGLALMSNRPRGDTTFRIHVRRPSGEIALVTATPDGSFAASPSWTPDGRSIAYEYDPDGPLQPSVGYFGGTDARASAPGPLSSRIHVIGADGRGDRAVTDGTTSCVTPAVRPR